MDLYFREFIAAAINFPCSRSWLRIGENDVVFSKIPHGLKILILGNNNRPFSLVYVVFQYRSCDHTWKIWSFVFFIKKPATWPRDTGQRIPCLDRCQLIVTWLSNIKEVHSKPRLYFCGVWPPCCATPSSSSSCVRAHEQYRWPREPWENQLMAFLFFRMISMGLRLAARTGAAL